MAWVAASALCFPAAANWSRVEELEPAWLGATDDPLETTDDVAEAGMRPRLAVLGGMAAGEAKKHWRRMLLTHLRQKQLRIVVDVRCCCSAISPPKLQLQREVPRPDLEVVVF